MASKEFWTTCRSGQEGSVGLLRVAETDAGPAITAVVIVGSDITSQTLKKVSFFSALSGLTNPSTFSWLTEDGYSQVDSLKALTGAIDAALEDLGTPEWSAQSNRSDRARLTRPDRSDPDGHAESVAAAYVEHLRAGRQPGIAIAEEAGVPVATARGWIREARRRGKLPKGRRGRAG